MISKSLKIFALLGAITALILFQDFFRFSLACRDYGKQASLGFSQFSPENQKVDALVVITGDKRRIPMALELLRNQPDSWLLISGVSKKTNLSEMMSLYKDNLSEGTGFWNRVILDSNATSTVQNAEETEKFIQTRKLNTIILITSDYHMLRALSIFKKRVSARVIPFVVGSEFTEPNLIKVPALLAKFLVEYWKWVAFRFDIY